MSWEAVAGVAGVVSSIAAAVGATAAWRAATASERTSRRATEALANTIMPLVRTRGVYNASAPDEVAGLHAQVVVANDGPHAARDIEVAVMRRDSAEIHRGSRRWMVRNDDILNIDVGPIDAATPDGYAGLTVATVTIRFTDTRGLATYERIEDFSNLIEPPCVPVATESRISPEPGPVVRAHGS